MIDVFKVGVHIGMTTNATQVLQTMLRELTGVHLAAGKLEQSLGRIGQAALGAAAVFVGWEVGKGIWHAIEGNRELNKELEKTKQLGGAWAANIGAARQQAITTQGQVPTTTFADNVRLLREVGQNLGHPDAANAMLSEAAKAAFVVSHYTGENQEDIIKNLMRAADARGHIFAMGADGKEHVDPAMLHAEIEAAAKGLILGGGFIKSSDILQETRMAGLAGRGQAADVFYTTGVESAIMLGASKTGTAETGLIQQFIGGTMTKKIAEHLQEAGLLHAGEWHSGRSGGVVVNSDVAARFAGVQSDPQAYFSTGEGAAAIKEYADKNHITNMMAVLQLFGRQTTQRLVADFMGNAPQFDRARQIFGGIGTIDSQFNELMGNDIDTNMIAMSAAWKSFMEAFSDAGAPAVIAILHDLTIALQFLARATAEHPDAVRRLTELAAGITTLTALGGGIALFMVAWSPFVGGIRLLVGVAGLATLGASLGGIAAGLAALAAMPAAFDWLNKSLGIDPGTVGRHNPNNNPVPGAVAPPVIGRHGPGAFGKQSMNDSGVMVVHVANAGDIGRAITGGMADGTSRPSSGPSFQDYRYDGAQPGFAVG